MARRIITNQTQYFSEFGDDGYIIPDPLMNTINSKVFTNRRFTTYRVSREDLHDVTLISSRLYNTERLWWFILITNDVVDPFNDLSIGMELKVLPMEEVYSILQSLKLRA